MYEYIWNNKHVLLNHPCAGRGTRGICINGKDVMHLCYATCLLKEKLSKD